MCTAITYKTKDSYFGRNLDLEYSYNESVTVTPRNYKFKFRMADEITSHYAMIGMAYVVGDYPLYYDAMNERGLSIAGLNFPENAVYYDPCGGKDNITPFELIPWLLSDCATISDVKAKLSKINIVNISFSEKLPLSPLHWIISDKEASIVVETMADGMKIYDNPVGVMTNNPPFDFMLHYLAGFRDLSADRSENRFCGLELPAYSKGLAAMGLPGDYSSASRFVRASFIKLNSVSSDDELSSVSQFFHILSGVEMPRGCVRLGDGKNEITVYTSCCNQDRGIYYYTTYDNRQTSAVDMHRENLDGSTLVSYPLIEKQSIFWQN